MEQNTLQHFLYVLINYYMPVNEVESLYNKYIHSKDLKEVKENKYLKDMVSSWINASLPLNKQLEPLTKETLEQKAVESLDKKTTITASMSPEETLKALPKIQISDLMNNVLNTKPYQSGDAFKSKDEEFIVNALSGKVEEYKSGSSQTLKDVVNASVNRLESPDDLQTLPWNQTKYGDIDDKFIDMETSLPSVVKAQLEKPHAGGPDRGLAVKKTKKKKEKKNVK